MLLPSGASVDTNQSLFIDAEVAYRQANKDTVKVKHHLPMWLWAGPYINFSLFTDRTGMSTLLAPGILGSCFSSAKWEVYSVMARLMTQLIACGEVPELFYRSA